MEKGGRERKKEVERGKERVEEGGRGQKIEEESEENGTSQKRV